MLIEQLKKSFFEFLKFNFSLKEVKNIVFELNTDGNKRDFGDISSNAAMVLAKKLGRNPIDMAQEISNNFKSKYVEKIEVAGPGFLNFFLIKSVLPFLLRELFEQKEDFFKLDPEMKRLNYSIEFVSANPTGPLHLGHGRGGIIGDVLGNVLRFLGHKVTKEYYINDAGSQIKKLGESFKLRCQQAAGLEIIMPEDAYHGEYLIDLAKEFISTYGKEILHKDNLFFAQAAETLLLQRIKNTLKDYGIEMDVWFSEKKLHDSGEIKKTIDFLEKHNFVYEKDNALWFKSKKFGDEKDRVLRKSDGNLTYVAADSAYLRDKMNRGFDRLIMVLGQDHHSYVVRLQGLMEALGYKKEQVYVILYQLVTMKEGGEILRMSKRTGKIITLRDVINMVGKDVARFFYLNRKVDAHLEFDVDLALKKTEENPVYYIQYAYVRIKSILNKANEETNLTKLDIKDICNIGKEEDLLIKKIITLKELLFNISNNYQIHLLSYYILDLAKTFHSYYSGNRIVDLGDIEKSRARLVLMNVLKNNFEICLKLLGISCPEKM